MNKKEKQINTSKKDICPDKVQPEQTSEYAKAIKQIIKDSNDAAHGKGEYTTYEEIFGEEK